MTAAVVGIFDRTDVSPDAVKADMIEMLQAQIANIEAGDVVSLALVNVRSDGTSGSAYVANGKFAAIVGALEFLKHRIITE